MAPLHHHYHPNGIGCAKYYHPYGNGCAHHYHTYSIGCTTPIVLAVLTITTPMVLAVFTITSPIVLAVLTITSPMVLAVLTSNVKAASRAVVWVVSLAIGESFSGVPMNVLVLVVQSYASVLNLSLASAHCLAKALFTISLTYAIIKINRFQFENEYYFYSVVLKRVRLCENVWFMTLILT